MTTDVLDWAMRLLMLAAVFGLAYEVHMIRRKTGSSSDMLDHLAKLMQFLSDPQDEYGTFVLGRIIDRRRSLMDEHIGRPMADPDGRSH